MLIPRHFTCCLVYRGPACNLQGKVHIIPVVVIHELYIFFSHLFIFRILHHTLVPGTCGGSDARASSNHWGAANLVRSKDSHCRRILMAPVQLHCRFPVCKKFLGLCGSCCQGICRRVIRFCIFHHKIQRIHIGLVRNVYIAVFIKHKPLCACLAGKIQE